MMRPFPIEELIWPTIAIAGVGFVISFCLTRHVVLSYWAAALKAGLFLLYFAFFFDGTYTFSDDWRYFYTGELLARNHIGIINFIGNYDYVIRKVGGADVAYFVYNATALRVFGYGYYAPVAANVILTFLGAGFLMKAARIGLGMSRRTSIGLFAFLVLNPDILVWSTIPNLKDILVATATAAVVYAVALVDGGRIWRAVLIAIAGAAVLAITRIYVPLMLGAAFGATLFLSSRGRRNPWLWLLAILALVAIIRVLGHGSLTGALETLRSQMDNPLAGVLRFLVTPVPFHAQSEYAFLNVPQAVYWALLPFMMYGILAVWKKSTIVSRFMVIYFLAMILLYGSFTLLQGPRHRVQIDGLLVIFQFYGILAFLRLRFRQQPQSRPCR